VKRFRERVGSRNDLVASNAVAAKKAAIPGLLQSIYIIIRMKHDIIKS
jgi:hypothetical protein